MSFDRRRAQPPHECPTPRWRWLPWLVWPRWTEGAIWRCGNDHKEVVWKLHIGCGARWEWRNVGQLRGERASWVRVPR